MNKVILFGLIIINYCYFGKKKNDNDKSYTNTIENNQQENLKDINLKENKNNEEFLKESDEESSITKNKIIIFSSIIGPLVIFILIYIISKNKKKTTVVKEEILTKTQSEVSASSVSSSIEKEIYEFQPLLPQSDSLSTPPQSGSSELLPSTTKLKAEENTDPTSLDQSLKIEQNNKDSLLSNNNNIIQKKSYTKEDIKNLIQSYQEWLNSILCNIANSIIENKSRNDYLCNLQLFEDLLYDFLKNKKTKDEKKSFFLRNVNDNVIKISLTKGGFFYGTFFNNIDSTIEIRKKINNIIIEQIPGYNYFEDIEGKTLYFDKLNEDQLFQVFSYVDNIIKIIKANMLDITIDKEIDDEVMNEFYENIKDYYDSIDQKKKNKIQSNQIKETINTTIKNLIDTFYTDIDNKKQTIKAINKSREIEYSLREYYFNNSEKKLKKKIQTKFKDTLIIFDIDDMIYFNDNGEKFFEFDINKEEITINNQDLFDKFLNKNLLQQAIFNTIDNKFIGLKDFLQKQQYQKDKNFNSIMKNVLNIILSEVKIEHKLPKDEEEIIQAKLNLFSKNIDDIKKIDKNIKNLKLSDVKDLLKEIINLIDNDCDKKKTSITDEEYQNMKKEYREKIDSLNLKNRTMNHKIFYYNGGLRGYENDLSILNIQNITSYPEQDSTKITGTAYMNININIKDQNSISIKDTDTNFSFELQSKENDIFITINEPNYMTNFLEIYNYQSIPENKKFKFSSLNETDKDIVLCFLKKMLSEHKTNIEKIINSNIEKINSIYHKNHIKDIKDKNSQNENNINTKNNIKENFEKVCKLLSKINYFNLHSEDDKKKQYKIVLNENSTIWIEDNETYKYISINIDNYTMIYSFKKNLEKNLFYGKNHMIRDIPLDNNDIFFPSQPKSNKNNNQSTNELKKLYENIQNPYIANQTTTGVAYSVDCLEEDKLNKLNDFMINIMNQIKTEIQEKTKIIQKINNFTTYWDKLIPNQNNFSERTINLEINGKFFTVKLEKLQEDQDRKYNYIIKIILSDYQSKSLSRSEFDFSTSLEFNFNETNLQSILLNNINWFSTKTKKTINNLLYTTNSKEIDQIFNALKKRKTNSQSSDPIEIFNMSSIELSLFANFFDKLNDHITSNQ